MNAILAILFAVSLSNTSIGKFWTMPAGYPRSTSTGDTPGSDGFAREMHMELSKRAAAGYYAVMDGYDTRRYVFSLTNDKPNAVVVNTDALDFYDALLSRKENLKDWPVFSLYASGMVFGKYMNEMGFADFNAFGWTEDPLSDDVNYIGWWPVYGALNSGTYISCDGAYGGVAKDAFDRLPQMGSITNHDWTADVVYEDMTADAFMEYAYARPVVSNLTTTSRELDWRPIEASAAVLGAYDKMYQLMADGYVVATNSTIYGSAVTKSRGGIEMLKVTRGNSEWKVERIGGTGPIDVGSVYTNIDESVVSNAEVALSCPSIIATKPTAFFHADGSTGIVECVIQEDDFWYMAAQHDVSTQDVVYITWEGVPSEPHRFSIGHYDIGGHWVSWTTEPYFIGTTNNLVDFRSFDVPVSAYYRSAYTASHAEPPTGSYDVHGFNPFKEIRGYVGTNSAYVLSAMTTLSGGEGISTCEYRGDEYSGTAYQLDNSAAFRDNMGTLNEKAWDNFCEITQSSDIYNAIDYTQCRSKFDEAVDLSTAVPSDIAWVPKTIWSGRVDIDSHTVISEIPSAESELILSYTISAGVSSGNSPAGVETRPDAKVLSFKSWVGEARLNFPTQFSGQDGGAGSGHAGGWGVLELKNNVAGERALESSFIGAPYYGAEMDEPVVYAKHRSFYGAFIGCFNLHFVHANLLKEAGESSFEKAFYNCASLTDASFNGLPYAGDRAFKEAFVNTAVGATSFASLTNCGAYAFENAYAGDTNLTEISFPSLVGFGTGAFKGAFSNATALTGLRFSSIEYVPTNVFNSSFVDCVALTNVDFGLVKVCRDDAFNGAFEDAKNIENVDFHSLTNCGARAFRKAFAGTVEPQAFKFKELAFDDLVTAGGGAFEEAFAYSDGISESEDARKYTAVTNVSFRNLTYIPSNFLYYAFGKSENYYEDNMPVLPTVRRVDFHSVVGFSPYAQGDYGIMGFGICTNLRHAAFDSLQSGVVNLDDVTAPLVVSASNVAESAVVDVSQCTNLREIRFDTVPSVVHYDSRWIPQNADWKAYVPFRLYYEWIGSDGWNQRASNIALADGGIWSGMENYGDTYHQTMNITSVFVVASSSTAISTSDFACVYANFETNACPIVANRMPNGNYEVSTKVPYHEYLDSARSRAMFVYSKDGYPTYSEVVEIPESAHMEFFGTYQWYGIEAGAASKNESGDYIEIERFTGTFYIQFEDGVLIQIPDNYVSHDANADWYAIYDGSREGHTKFRFKWENDGGTRVGWTEWTDIEPQE